MAFNCLKATEPLLEDSLLFTSKSQGDLWSFSWPQEGERLSRPSSRVVILNLKQEHRIY